MMAKEIAAASTLSVNVVTDKLATIKCQNSIRLNIFQMTAWLNEKRHLFIIYKRPSQQCIASNAEG